MCRSADIPPSKRTYESLTGSETDMLIAHSGSMGSRTDIYACLSISGGAGHQSRPSRLQLIGVKATRAEFSEMVRNVEQITKTA